MANSTATGFVGVPKREPCRKCGNPVFFAERISFEQKLYHRSCLKCARCNAQLTLGSFYETETDGEYCCETCPDEEIQLSKRRRSSAGGSDSPASTTNGSRTDGVRVNRSSSKLLDRISFFESAPLSDEEKSSNLVRRAKISSFLKDTLDSSGDGFENGHVEEIKETSKLAEPIESEDESESDDEPPDPPTTAPPEMIVSKEEPPAEPFMKDEEVLEEKVETVKLETAEIALEESVDSKPECTVEPSCDVEESQKDIVLSRRNSSTSNTVEVNKTAQDEQEALSVVEELVSNVIDLVENVKPEQPEEEKPSEALDETTADIPVEEVPKVVESLEEPPTISIKEEVPISDTEVLADIPVVVPTTVVTTPEEDNVKDDASTKAKELYPTDLNPFGEDSDEEQPANITKPVPSARRVSTNPFGSDDEEESSLPVSVKPPRPPPPKLKTAVPANPFDEDGDDEPENAIVPVIVKPSPRRTPVPTPRKQHNHNDSISSMETSLMSSQFGGSTLSLASSMESGPSTATISRRKKSRAPDIPVSLTKASAENLAGSTATTPRKKRVAPAPPTVSSTPKQPDSKTSSPKSTQRLIALDASLINNDDDDVPHPEPTSKPPSDDSVVYRRTIVPLKVDDDSLTLDSGTTTTTTSERQWEKMKDNKEAQNRNRQSQTSPTSSQNDSYNSFISNKSQQGKWKRRKGPAPALPVALPERKAIKMLPLKEIRQELDIIETQQQGLEKQGVILEQMIRERCEGVGPEMDISGIQTNSKEVEDLIMQLFELVNEKNELFRRQAELMYLRRQHRLEQEQADLEYEIRLLMAQPERNKTDSDKEKEEALIARLVEIVQMRNEVVDCLEMDRLREAEEDMSIKQSIEERAANQQRHGKKDSDTSEKSASGDSTMKLSKKEKKKLKEAKKLVKSKKIDSEKDADDTESSTKEKKKKKKFFADFLHHK